MGASATEDQDEEITSINVTPLVDVMLVLLIIFMVTATYIVNKSINVNLPKAATGSELVGENLALVLDKESNLYFNGDAISIAELPERIDKARESGKSLQALIAADKDTPHGSVVKLIDVVRKAGIDDFAINVEIEGP